MKWKELIWEYPYKDPIYHQAFRNKRYLRDWVSKTTEIFLLFVIVLSILIFLIQTYAYVVKWDCDNFERNTNITTEYKDFTCYAEYDGQRMEKSKIVFPIQGDK